VEVNRGNINTNSGRATKHTFCNLGHDQFAIVQYTLEVGIGYRQKGSMCLKHHANVIMSVIYIRRGGAWHKMVRFSVQARVDRAAHGVERGDCVGCAVGRKGVNGRV